MRLFVQLEPQVSRIPAVNFNTLGLALPQILSENLKLSKTIVVLFASLKPSKA
jgi:hypothetical protein